MDLLIRSLSTISPLIGMGCLVAAVSKHRARLAHLRSAELINGEVTMLEPDDYDETRWPYFSAILPDGSLESFRGKVGSDPQRFTVGQKVEIFFSASADPRFIVRDKWEMWGTVKILYILGVFGLILPLALKVFELYLKR